MMGLLAAGLVRRAGRPAGAGAVTAGEPPCGVAASVIVGQAGAKSQLSSWGPIGEQTLRVHHLRYVGSHPLADEPQTDAGTKA